MSINGPVNFKQDFVNAAEYVLKEHLSKPYSDNFDGDGRGYGIGREWIDRPVHGLIHTLRTTAYAPIYLELSKKQKPSFYAHIDENELQKIMIAQLFFVAGRESEDSNTEAYHKYHEAGAKYFETYAGNHLRHLFSEADIRKYRGIIADKEDKFKCTAEADIIRKAHAIELIRARTPDHLFYKKAEDEGGYNGIGRGQLEAFKSGEIAVELCHYALDLFDVTGDMIPKFDNGPGKQYQMWVNRIDPKSKKFIAEELRTITDPKDTPIFKREPKEANTILFEQCQYSVKKCLEQIASVKPPFGMTYEIASIKPSAQYKRPNAKKDQQAQKERIKTKVVKHSPEDKQEITKLMNEKEEQEGLLKILKVMQAQEQGYQQQINQAKDRIKQIDLEIDKIKKSKGVAVPTVNNYDAGNYQVMTNNYPCLDDVLRDKVKIPPDGNCCFNAVLTGAYQAQANIPVQIKNHYDLRRALIEKMRQDYKQRLQDYRAGDSIDQEKHQKYIHAKPWVEELYPNTITNYNRQFGTSFTELDEYIEHMAKLDTWGGAFELGIMAEILNVKIVVHGVEQDVPISINDQGSPTIHVNHTGVHYNLYVAPNSWQPLSQQHPIIAFQNQIDTIRYQNIVEAMARQVIDAKVDFQINKDKRPPTRNSQLVINYENYFKFSVQMNKLGDKIKELDFQIKETENSSQKNKLRAELKGAVTQFMDNKIEVEQIRKYLLGNKGLIVQLEAQLQILFKEYDKNIKVIEDANFLYQSLLDKKIEFIGQKVHPESVEFKKLEQDILRAKKIKEEVKSNAKSQTDYLGLEIEFAIRELHELGAINVKQQSSWIAHYKAKKVTAKQRLADTESKHSKFGIEDKTALTHLKMFLGDKYKPELSLKENIKIYFNHPTVREMLHKGGPVGGFQNLGEVDERFVFKPNGDRYDEEGVYDEELIEHYSEMLAKMIEAEQNHPDSFVLYNAMTANLSTGNDVIREISAIFQDKEYNAMFRLFEEFSFENAEKFREHIYDKLKVMDAGEEFHKCGLACGLSPFQPMVEESPLDFWSHNRNVQTFERWQKEIFPKLAKMIDDEETIKQLNKKYEELIQLSDQMGARMTQFMMTKEDMDKYTWMSGAYGFKLPAVKHENDNVYPTPNLSDALAFYRKYPEEFVKRAGAERNKYLSNEENAKVFIDARGVNQRDKAYDRTYDNQKQERENMGQFQARLYLHPDLFEPNRMDINTYYASPPNVALEMEYNRKVKEFAQQICGLVMEKNRKLQQPIDDVPEELTKSFALRPFVYKDLRQYEEAVKLLDEMIPIDKPRPEKATLEEPLMTQLLEEMKKSKKLSERINNIEAFLSKNSDSPSAKMAHLEKLFFCSIVTGNKEALDALIKYASSEKYDGKNFPINLDKIPNAKGERKSALIFAAQYRQPELLQDLLNFRESRVAFINWGSNHLNITRTVIDEKTKNTPLHYLAEQGQLDSFKKIANSLSETRSWTSYMTTVATQKNASGNNPLHFLAMNTPGTNHQRIDILKFIVNEMTKERYDILFDPNALTDKNASGISPIMIAAITQNFEAIDLLCEKAQLTNNQKLIYQWVAANPSKRIAIIQQNKNEYGNIPGFVSLDWKCHEKLKGFNLDLDQRDISKIKQPETIAQIKSHLVAALSLPDNKQTVEFYYKELVGAKSKEDIDIFVNDLLPRLTQEKKTTEVKNLNNLIKAQKINIKSRKVDGDPILIATIKQGSMDIVLQLLEDKKQLAVKRTETDSTNNAALHYLAARNDSDDAIIKLLQRGSYSQAISSYWDPTRIANNEGNNPLHIMVSEGKINTLQKIEKEFKTSGYIYGSAGGLYNTFYGAAFDVNKDGYTPVMIAVVEHYDKPDLIKLCGNAMGVKPAMMRHYLELADGLKTKNNTVIDNSIKLLNANASTLAWNSKLGLDSKKLQELQSKPPKRRLGIK